jgi:putative flavoprotein involved in K+ transport
MKAPLIEAPEPLRLKTRTEIDLAREDVGAIVWTSGYRPEYGWMKLAVTDDMGFPVTSDGASAVPGLYFVGVHWMRKLKSAILYGVGEDAQVVARQIVENRR